MAEAAQVDLNMLSDFVSMFVSIRTFCALPHFPKCRMQKQDFRNGKVYSNHLSSVEIKMTLLGISENVFDTYY